jgi:hypothetical protein
MHSLIAATARREPMHRRPIHRKAAARFPAAFRALFRFPTRTVRKPQEAVILATITACLMVETNIGNRAGTLGTTGTERAARSPAGRVRLAASAASRSASMNPPRNRECTRHGRTKKANPPHPPSLSKSFSLAPVFLGLALHRWSRRVLHLEPISRAA